jgi:hypothetical protein
MEKAGLELVGLWELQLAQFFVVVPVLSLSNGWCLSLLACES